MTEHGQKLVLTYISFGEFPRRCLTVEQCGFGPLTLGDLPLVTLEVAGDWPSCKEWQQTSATPAQHAREPRTDITPVDRPAKPTRAFASCETPQRAAHPPMPTRSAETELLEALGVVNTSERSPRKHKGTQAQARHRQLAHASEQETADKPKPYVSRNSPGQGTDLSVQDVAFLAVL